MESITKDERDYYFDNSKLLLMLLVIVGHLSKPIFGYDLDTRFKAVYIFIYSFHMPAFILISGYFHNGKAHNVREYVDSLLIPYFIFQIIYLFSNVNFRNHNMNFSMALPEYLTWYLLVIFAYKLITPFWIRLKHPLIFSFIFSILGGFIYDIGEYLSLSRILVFYPFYLAGVFMKREQIRSEAYGRIRYLSLLIFMVTFYIFYHFRSQIHVEWLWGVAAYRAFGIKDWTGGLYRLSIYGLQFLMALSFFTLVPDRKLFFSKAGQKTIYIYLFHGLIIRFLEQKGLFSGLSSTMRIVAVTTLPLIITAVLSVDFVTEKLKYIVQPRVDWLYKR